MTCSLHICILIYRRMYDNFSYTAVYIQRHVIGSRYIYNTSNLPTQQSCTVLRNYNTESYWIGARRCYSRRVQCNLHRNGASRVWIIKIFLWISEFDVFKCMYHRTQLTSASQREIGVQHWNIYCLTIYPACATSEILSTFNPSRVSSSR